MSPMICKLFFTAGSTQFHENIFTINDFLLSEFISDQRRQMSMCFKWWIINRLSIFFSWWLFFIFSRCFFKKPENVSTVSNSIKKTALFETFSIWNFFEANMSLSDININNSIHKKNNDRESDLFEIVAINDESRAISRLSKKDVK